MGWMDVVEGELAAGSITSAFCGPIVLAVQFPHLATNHLEDC